MKSQSQLIILLLAAILLLFARCSKKINTENMQEVQLTSGLYGHMLNSTQVFSPDDEWVVYDTRNDQTHISRTCCIEKVNVKTGAVVKLYSAPGQTLHGPGVGAVACHPFQPKIIFIHGLLNCDEANPYSFTRRFGAMVDESLPGEIKHAEARTTEEPLIDGALRGGTHAHSWSGDGKWISFTYNDWLLEKLEKSNGPAKDLRTIGVMAPLKPVVVTNENAENFSGEYFSVVAATVTETPKPGSDEIEKAVDECWVGAEGYIKRDGSRQKRAIAFQGILKQYDGSTLTEIFLSDIPEDITVVPPGASLAGSLTTRPSVPAALVQRRVTFTAGRKFPGVQGPRFWVRSSPDGAFLYFLMKDDQEVVQVFEVSSNGSDPRQVTHLQESVQAQFNISPDGKALALIADNSLWIADIRTEKTIRITPRTSDDQAPVISVLWNHAGNSIVYNKYVRAGENRYLQIFKMNL